jgi:hypothetical protein
MKTFLLRVIKSNRLPHFIIGISQLNSKMQNILCKLLK